jgi:site-specific DNA-cytosine methylase
MVRWDESALTQCLPIHDGYVITGTGEERTAQVGNAVSANAAQWLGHAAAEVLCAA